MKFALALGRALLSALFFIGGVGCSPSFSPSQESTFSETAPETEASHGRLVYELISVEQFQQEAIPSAVAPTMVKPDPPLFHSTRLSVPIPEICKESLPNGMHAYTFNVEGEEHPREIRDRIEPDNGIVSWKPVGSIQIRGKSYPILFYIAGFCASEIIDLGLKLFFAGAPPEGFSINKSDFEDRSIPILHDRYVISVSPSRIAVLDLETGHIYEEGEQFAQLAQKAPLLEPLGFGPVFPSPPIFYALRERKRGCIIYFPGSRAEETIMNPSIPPHYLRVEW
ncbi:MAG: hypothetical protein NZ580_03170 [Bacteroidia bacterium]|nr:hypothetical protein [Bacteroidia bacterium]MDW8235610.1 hypothetical protein [Bacteroidia bacterium]